MRRTTINLDDEQCEMLDRVAAEEGKSRSEVISILIQRGLGGGDSGLEEDLPAIEQSFAVLDDLEPVVPGRDERSEHLDRIWHLTR